MKMKLTLSILAIACVYSAHGALVFYEGFDYAAGNLDGNGGWSAASGDPQVSLNGVVHADASGYDGTGYTGTYSAVTTTGGYMYNPNSSADYASVALGSSVTSTFTDGAVTWLSLISIRGTNGANARFGLAIGGYALTGERWGTEMAGDGIGLTTYQTSNTGKAGYWTPNGAGEDVSVSGSIPGGTGRDRFTIAKITWSDAGNDTIEWAFFDAGATINETNFNAAGKSTISADLDQSTFDTLSFTSGSVEFDEIRIATDFDSAVTGTVVIPEPSTLVLFGLGWLALLRRRR